MLHRLFRRMPVGILALATASCSLAPQIGGPPRPTTPIALPISASISTGNRRVEGFMQVRGPCLTINVVEGNTFKATMLPIWPLGFAAKGSESEGILLTGPLAVPTDDAINSERLELHGELVNHPPPDAVVPDDCAGYQLFVVSRALNIAQ